MIDYLLVMLIIAAAIQPTREGRAAACTFAGLTVAFSLIRVPDGLYHLAAAATDGVCILLLTRMRSEHGLVVGLQRLCLLSMVINFAGWVSYEMYLSATTYNSVFAVFYSVTIVSLFLRRIGNAHGSTTTYRSWIPFYFHSFYISDREQEAKSCRCQAN